MLLKQLKESTAVRYIVVQAHGNGPVFKVRDNLDTVGADLRELLVGSSTDFCQVFEMRGEILGMGMGGDTGVDFDTTGPNESIFHYEHGEVYEDNLDLQGRYELEID